MKTSQRAIFVFICIYFVCSVSGAFAANADNKYRALLRAFHKNIIVENDIFRRLIFTPIKKEISTGGRQFKVIVSDQFGDKWIFKPFPNSVPNIPLAGYRVYKFFGAPTPEIHLKCLTIEGEEFFGYMTRFVDNSFTAETFDELDKYTITEAAISDALRQVAINMLLRNKDLHLGNLLLEKKEGDEIARIYAIDLEMIMPEWIGERGLYSFMEEEFNNEFYKNLFNCFAVDTINTKKDMFEGFINFIAQTPDAVLEQVVLTTLDASRIKLLINSKGDINSVADDMMRLCSLQGTYASQGKIDKIIKQRVKALQQDTKKKQKALKKIQKMPLHAQKDLRGCTSVRAWFATIAPYSFRELGEEEKKSIYADNIIKLETLYSLSERNDEKKVILRYLDAFKYLLEGKNIIGGYPKWNSAYLSYSGENEPIIPEKDKR